MTDPLVASEGWGVIHCYFRLRATDSQAERRGGEASSALVEELCCRARLSGDLERAAR